MDLGSASGVKPGDVLTIFKPNEENASLPRLKLGEGVVLLADNEASVPKIMSSSTKIYAGDRVEAR
jgi:hypothetical protein